MTILESINSFEVEDKKEFNFYQVESELTSVDETEKASPDFRYEVTAMKLVPTQEDNPWDFYFGPQLTFTDKDGNSVYVPCLNDITPDAIAYWENRAQACKNPLLKARYAGLVWDFKQKIAHQNQESWMYRLYVDSMLRVCNEDYCSHPVITVNVLERLFVLTRNKPADLQLTKDAYTAFETRHAKDKAVRMWASRFMLMTENKKYFTDDEKEALVKEHEERLIRLSTPNEDDRVDPWIIQKQAGLLATYYSSLQMKEDVKRVLNIVESAFEHERNNLSAMQLMGNLKTVCQSYSHYGLKEDFNQLAVKIQELGVRVKDEMQPFQTEFKIPQEVYDQADADFGDKAESEDVRWNNFASYFIPRKSQEEINLKELVKKYPFKFMIGNNLMDAKGHPMSYVGSYESDPEGQLILHMSQNLYLQSYYLYIAINRLLTTHTLTSTNVMNSMIIPSPIFEEDRYDIIREAIDLFIEGKYILFCHLIVPQIEYAICNMVEMSGISILKPPKKNNGYQIRTLDDLLREQCVADILTPDGALYLQLVLTNQKALNIRNLLCHGNILPKYFSTDAAGRLFHVLVILGLIRSEPVLIK